MSKRMEFWGDFWLESAPEHRVPGHLTFHPRRGGRLLLHRALEPDPAGFAERRHYDRIRGHVLGRACVLLDCFVQGNSSSEPEPGQWESNVSLFVNRLLLLPVRHTDSPAERFRGVSAGIDGLAEFDGRVPFERDRRDGEDPMTQRVTLWSLDDRTAETDRATIRIRQGTGAGHPHYPYRAETLRSRTSLQVLPHEPLLLDELVALYSRVRTLVAISMHQDCRLMGPLRLWPELRPGEDERDPYLSPYEFHAVWRRGIRRRHPIENRVLTFESLEAEGIARWLALDESEEFGHVISRLASIRYTRELAYEDALLRVMAAADSFHRAHTGKRREEAETMLRELAQYAGYPFRPAVPDVAAWAAAVVQERHNAAHNKGLPLSVEPTLTTALVESVYFLVLLCLLRRACVPDSAFEAVRESQPFVWPMKAIYEEFGGKDWGWDMPRRRR